MPAATAMRGTGCRDLFGAEPPAAVALFRKNGGPHDTSVATTLTAPRRARRRTPCSASDGRLDRKATKLSDHYAGVGPSPAVLIGASRRLR